MGGVVGFPNARDSDTAVAYEELEAVLGKIGFSKQARRGPFMVIKAGGPGGGGGGGWPIARGISKNRQALESMSAITVYSF